MQIGRKTAGEGQTLISATAFMQAAKRKENQNDYDEKNVKRKDAEKRKEQEGNYN